MNNLKAFRVLLNELILIDPLKAEFPRKTIAEISAIIQQQFIYQFESIQDTLAEKLSKEISLIVTDGAGNTLTKVTIHRKSGKPSPDLHMSQLSDSDFFKSHLIYMQASSMGHLPWGFTPKLAIHPDLDFLSTNCFGRATVLGSFCRARGMKVELAIGPDHPHIILYFEDTPYTIDETGSVIGLTGSFEAYDGYTIYRPLAAEKIMPGMLIVSSFDEAIVYEILENMETLRRVSLGIHTDFLPETYQETLTLATAHADVLQLTNWKEVQAYLFPGLTSAVTAHLKEWEQEIDHMAKKRLEKYHDMLLGNVMKKAFLTAFPSAVYSDEAHEQFLNRSSVYRDEIISFLRNEISFPSAVSAESRTYFTVYKSEILKIAEEKPELTQLIEYGHWLVEIILMTEVQKMIEKLKPKKEEQVC
jgi:hypothetical protein